MLDVAAHLVQGAAGLFELRARFVGLGTRRSELRSELIGLAAGPLERRDPLAQLLDLGTRLSLCLGSGGGGSIERSGHLPERGVLGLDHRSRLMELGSELLHRPLLSRQRSLRGVTHLCEALTEPLGICSAQRTLSRQVVPRPSQLLLASLKAGAGLAKRLLGGEQLRAHAELLNAVRRDDALLRQSVIGRLGVAVRRLRLLAAF